MSDSELEHSRSSKELLEQLLVPVLILGERFAPEDIWHVDLGGRGRGEMSRKEVRALRISRRFDIKGIEI